MTKLISMPPKRDEILKKWKEDGITVVVDMGSSKDYVGRIKTVDLDYLVLDSFHGVILSMDLIRAIYPVKPTKL